MNAASDRFAPVRVAMIALGIALGLSACDQGYTTQEAVDRCDVEKKNKPTLTEKSYAECVACFESCGDDCTPEGGTPERYVCPED